MTHTAKMLAKLLHFLAMITTTLRKKVTNTKHMSKSSFQTIWTMKVRWYVTDEKEELGLLEVSKLIRGKVCFWDYIPWR